jgi:hypothetical protein
LIHGDDEKISIDNVIHSVYFYLSLIEKLWDWNTLEIGCFFYAKEKPN